MNYDGYIWDLYIDGCSFQEIQEEFEKRYHQTISTEEIYKITEKMNLKYYIAGISDDPYLLKVLIEEVDKIMNQDTSSESF